MEEAKDELSGVRQHCMLSWWLNNGEQVSWSAVVRALEMLKITGLAQKIARKYGELLLLVIVIMF